MRRVNLVFLLATALVVARAPAQNTRHFLYAGTTGSNATIAIPLLANPNIAGIPLVGGDEIGVFTAGGICVGAAVWLEADAVLTVWGDNNLTPEVDGLTANEQMLFRVWSSVRNTEYSLVSVVYSNGNGLYSSNGIYVLSQLIAQAPPDKPSLLYPQNGSGNTSTSLMPSWNPLARTTAYHLQIATDHAFEQVVLDNNAVLDTKAAVGPLQKSTQFYWRVRGENAAGFGAWSDPWSFTTTAVSTPTHFSFTSGTGSNCTIALPVSINPCIGDRGLAPGDEVGVFSPAGLCVGATVWEGTNTALTVWGDNGQTIPVDGMLPGESISVKVWILLTGIEYQNVSVSYFSGSGVFVADQISVFSSLVAHPVFNLSLSDTLVDFGVLSLGSTLQDTVTLVNNNTSTDTLVVDLGGVSSPFSVISPVGRVSLPPGGSSQVVVRFSPGTQSTQPFGVSRDTVLVQTNGGLRTVVLSGESPFPQLQTDLPLINFWDVPVGSSMTVSLHLSNPSINTLQIDTVFTGGEAFSVDWTQKTIGASQAAILQVSFLPLASGTHVDTLKLHSNASTGLICIPLFGTVPVSRMVISAVGLGFGDVAVGDSSARSIWIRNASLSPLNLWSAVCSYSAFLTRQSFPVVIGGNDSLQMSVVFKPQRFGFSGDTLTISSDGGTCTVFLSGESPFPQLQTDFSSVDFGDLPVDSTGSVSLHLTNSSVNVLQIDTAFTGSNTFSLDWTRNTIGPSQGAILRVSFLPHASGTYRDTLKLVSNASTGLIRVPLAGSASVPRMVVSDMGIGFGDVAVGDSSVQNVWIRNASLSPLSLWSAVCSYSVFFTRQSFPVVIGGNDSLQLSVVFRPQRFGHSDDTLAISSNGGNYRIALSGQSSNPTIVLSQNAFDFGERKINVPFVLGGWITNNSVNPLVVDSIVVRSSQFRIDTGRFVVPRLDTLFLETSFIPNRYGMFKDTIAIYHNATPLRTLIPLRGSCPQPHLEMDYTLLDFGERVVRDSLLMHRIIRNPSVNALTISRIWTSDVHFHVFGSVSATVAANDSMQISVYFKPAIYGAGFADSLWIETIVGTAAIPLAGASPPPAVNSQPESVDFGSVREGTTSAVAKVRLTNSSINTAELDSVYTLTSHFSAAWLVGSKSIPRGDTGTVYLLFMPDSVGLFVDSGFAVIHGVSKKIAVPLRGLGTPTTGVPMHDANLSRAFGLQQNYPNPFNPQTLIRYQLPVVSWVTLTVYDLLGRAIAVLVDERKGAGEFEVTWDGSRVASGLYFYRIEAVSESGSDKRFAQVRKMVFMK
ncbi:MAG: choice-of-anchor D domain-containing protein [Bacteroidota bacterium]